MTLPIDRIGKFEITERLGEGSLGEVFLARDTIIGREVALKIIRKAALPAPDPEGRFLRECQAVSRMSHPNLATLHEFGQKGGILYLAMDYLPDGDLAARFRDHALTPKEALEWLAQVCDALAFLHQHGVCHRNLKPANVRIGRVAGRPAPKLLDGGLSRAAGVDAAGAAAQLDSLNYTAPECLGNGKVDGRADLFAVGVMLHEALTGRRPFDGQNPAEVAQRLREEEAPDLDLALFPELSGSLQGILRQAMAKDPARRFPSAETLAEALRAVRNPAWTAQPDTQWTLKPGKPLPAAGPAMDPPSHAWAGWVATGVAVAILGGGGAWWWIRRRPGRVAPPPLPHTVASPLQPTPPPATPGGQGATPAATPTATPAAPAAPAPTHVYRTLDEAVAAVDSDPQGALAFLEKTLEAEPANERALAHRIVALYDLKRYPEAGRAIRDAREAGYPLWPMALRNPALRQMLERDGKDPHLPRRKAPAPAPAPAADPEP
jgi:serine/threonine-protein kinase PpkA